ncbi:hypothetical protein ABZX62_00135 [Streptomyces flavidovirens]|uniref:hypothetical protein n=1 Tax=Streptomyces flavidovirens TaxID=67298 RepID=UPI0033A94DDF
MPDSPQPPPAATAITTAAPGWTVTTLTPQGGEPTSAPIAAWILTPHAAGPLGDSDLVQPVFVIDGSVWTTAEYNEIFGYGVTVVPPSGATQ